MERPKDGLNAAEPFLARWSRRKQEAGSEAVAAADGASAPPPAAAEPPPQPAPHVLTDADMPPLDGLRFDDDWSGFLSPGVSEQLRGRALRQLFHSAELNATDGLDSYSGDYTQFAALGDIVTADMRHRLARLLAECGPGEPAEQLPEGSMVAGRAERSPVDAAGPAAASAPKAPPESSTDPKS